MNTTIEPAASADISDRFVRAMRRRRRGRLAAFAAGAVLLAAGLFASAAHAASPCDTAANPAQCAWLDATGLPPYVQDAIAAKGGVMGAGNVLILTSGDPLDQDNEICTDRGLAGCGTNPDGWQTYDCTLMSSFVPPEDSVVMALSSEWFEWYQSIFTDWMTISGAGVATVDVSINSWINNKVDIIPYGPWETGVVLLTSLSAQKMVDFRVSDSGDGIYDTAIVVVPASWFSSEDVSGNDPTLLCGDDVLEPGEECDDGNLIADDGCSNLCLGSQPAPSTPPATASCGNLVYSWSNGSTLPYTCGNDLCAGFRCVIGNTISPACYTAEQCAAACGGSCVDVQTASLDCSTMCTVQPPANEPPVVVPPSCDDLSYVWPDGTAMPYNCDDDCHGQRCVTGSTISPECFKNDECDAACGGTCVDTPPDDCATFCAAAQLPSTCTDAEKGQTRLAVNQNGPCQGNLEICKSSLEWRLADNAFAPDSESCNGIDDDCNGVVDDMFATCGDFGLCQNTVNTCDPANPGVPVVCQPLPAPSPVEICNNGLDDDCEGSIDDGCECGDDECMPGEDWSNCQADCPMPANNTACDDGNPCTSGDSWQSGVCTGGAPVTCESENACVVAGTCDPATGCTATKLICDDGIACTVDSCDAATGCLATPEDSACADGDPCTIDTCDAVAGCTWTPDPSCLGEDHDGDGHVALVDGGDDCNDEDASVNPDAAEVCNGIDDNCDGNVDETFPTAGTTCFSGANSCGTVDAGLVVCTADTTGVECNAVTPADPANLGNACQSAANTCGQTAAGTILCDGSCSASTPADPVDLGTTCSSNANSCGQTSAGTIGCDGTCSATTPADPAGYGNACMSGLNSCGSFATGFIGCDGFCSVGTPPDPAGYGDACTSSANACGATASGTIGCDGTCSATTPANPAGYGDACTSAANACGQTASGTTQCDGTCSATTPAATDSDGDGTADCVDSCSADPAKTAPGDCGCGTPDADTNVNGISDCLETASADLGVTAELNTRTPAAGKHLRVRWYVANAGPDTVAPGATVTGSITGGAVTELRLPKGCTGTAEAFTCETTELKADRRKALKVQVVPAAGTTLTFAFEVSGPLVDPNPANQTASVEVTIP